MSVTNNSSFQHLTHPDLYFLVRIEEILLLLTIRYLIIENYARVNLRGNATLINATDVTCLHETTFNAILLRQQHVARDDF